MYPKPFRETVRRPYVGIAQFFQMLWCRASSAQYDADIFFLISSIFYSIRQMAEQNLEFIVEIIWDENTVNLA